MIPLPRIFLEAALIAVLGIVVGLASNQRLIRDAFAGRLTAPQSAAARSAATLPQPVLLAEVRELLAAGALPIDAREADLHAAGHLPGALSVPFGTAEARLDELRRQVAADRTLVLYCSGYGCPDSFDLGLLLMAAGYLDVRVFEGGFPEWRDAGLPVEAGGR
jgi:rhodanese-related sulfurtransferase